MELSVELSDIIAPERVLTRPIDLIAYASDASVYRLIPQAVVQPDGVEEIRALFELSRRRRVPLTFRAAGTSLSGQAVTSGILVDLSKFWRRITVEEGGARVHVQPGVVGATVNRILRPYSAKIGPDPASINACMMGGILANNASGMCCGVAQNSYHTLEALTFMLPDGTCIDTAAGDANTRFVDSCPGIADGLLALKKRLEDNPGLVATIRHKYRTKNTTGYALNALLDYSKPVEIMRHLLIGSEGTLAFIAEAVLNTVPDLPCKYTGVLFFANIRDASDAIVPLRDSGAVALELMDRASLRSVEDQKGALAEMKGLPDTAAAILVEYQTATSGELAGRIVAAADVCERLSLVQPPNFTDNPERQAALWKIRKGLFPSVGAVRQLGTSVIIEDVVFPVDRLADAVVDLQSLFRQHKYPDGIIFGHAKDGNLHFVITQSFNDQPAIDKYDRFMRDIVALVVDKYGGAVKAEHGTGRNMAPFVEAEWGGEAYAVMAELKQLIDPHNLLNPGVIINDDPNAHIKNLKSLPTIDPESDTCIECGFCEPKCPSRDLTLTPRQRIVVRREMARLQAAGDDAATLASLRDSYRYDGLDTCAADGLCATACPVAIDTGKLVKRLRCDGHGQKAHTRAVRFADRLARLESLARLGLRLGHLTQKILGAGVVRFGARLAGAVLGTKLPTWSTHMPKPAAVNFPGNRRDGAVAVYFPTCVTRTMGSLPGEDAVEPLWSAMLSIAERAGKPLWIPDNCAGQCCGTPFSSKGFTGAYVQTVNLLVDRMWTWSDGGKLPIVLDTSPCTHTMTTCRDDLTPANRERYDKLEILDSVAFVHDHLLPSLELQPIADDVVLHPVCSVTKMGLDGKLTAIANACAESSSVPVHAGCCGFAGDRGLLFPELAAAATRAEAAEVTASGGGRCYSSSRTCELGLSIATGRIYQSFIYLVERASR
ncbi:MAG: FAD-binding and (Fe-S)-binding domain-containing protein [Lentisphaeria bacterium]|jgi:D-lactate dehydrogenase|nr:FAD-binding and (Fe-S)-binding domain-containing protein [Lentisphaeria bacterium]